MLGISRTLVVASRLLLAIAALSVALAMALRLLIASTTASVIALVRHFEAFGDQTDMASDSVLLRWVQ